MATERRTIPVMRENARAAKDCPLAPPEHASVFARTLHRACLIAGGIRHLAKQIQASEADLRSWMAGEQAPPERVFHAAIEIVLLYASGGGAAN